MYQFFFFFKTDTRHGRVSVEHGHVSWAETPGLLDTPVYVAVCALVSVHGRVTLTHDRVMLLPIYLLFIYLFFLRKTATNPNLNAQKYLSK